MNLDPPFADPGIPDGETTAYRGRIGDDEVGAGELAVSAAEGEYGVRLEARILADYNARIEMAFSRRRGLLRAEHYRAETRDRERMVSVEEGWFRDVRGLHWGAELNPYPANVTPLIGCAVALRGLDFVKGERHHLALWLASSVWWEIAIHVQRRERIDVAAGSFDAWHVTAHPQFEPVGDALNRIIQAVLPPFRLHFDAEPPHRLLRFSFPTGPFPWNPRGLIEATALRV